MTDHHHPHNPWRNPSGPPAVTPRPSVGLLSSCLTATALLLMISVTFALTVGAFVLVFRWIVG